LPGATHDHDLRLAVEQVGRGRVRRPVAAACRALRHRPGLQCPEGDGGMKVLTIGTFAVPHIGHAAYLRACAAFGELTVGVNSDRFVAEYRGVAPPFDQHERLELIASLGYRVQINDGPGRDLIESERPA